MKRERNGRRFLLSVLAGAFCIGSGALGAGPNLVRNGDFEKGKGGQPAWWSKVDGLTTFWERGGKSGRCVRFDTSVQQKDKRAFQRDPQNFKGRSKGGKYSTVGAHEGVWLWSWPIEVKPTDRYFIIEADVKGPAKSTMLFYPQVLIRGYQKFDLKRHGETSSYFQVPHEGGPAYSEQFGKKQRPAREGDYLMVYRHSLVCRLPAANRWFHFKMGFKIPTIKKYRPDVLLLKLYAMWPLGNYWFDNVTLRRATRAEYDKAKRERHSIKGFLPGE